jgi:hypothetical protein
MLHWYQQAAAECQKMRSRCQKMKLTMQEEVDAIRQLAMLEMGRNTEIVQNLVGERKKKKEEAGKSGLRASVKKEAEASRGAVRKIR